MCNTSIIDISFYAQGEILTNLFGEVKYVLGHNLFLLPSITSRFHEQILFHSYDVYNSELLLSSIFKKTQL